MIKHIISLIIILVPAVSLADTVSNTQYIQKKIDLIQEEADLSYDEIKNIFSEENIYNTSCFKNSPAEQWSGEEEAVDSRLNRFRPVPTTYLHQFQLVEKEWGFDLISLVTVQEQSFEAAFDHEIYGAQKKTRLHRFKKRLF